MEQRLIDANGLLSNYNLSDAEKRYNGDWHGFDTLTLYEIRGMIDDSPTIGATPVIHAHWKEVEPGHDILFECSNCGRIISTSWGSCEDEDTKGCNGCDPTEEWLCCPTCRALMDGKDDSHETN